MKDRAGFALLYALLVFMALSLVGLGVMATGAREAAIARALERHGRVRALAESAVLEVVSGWSTRSHSALPVGSERDLTSPPGFPGTSVAVLRLDSTLYLVRAEASAPSPGVGPATVRPGSVRAGAGLLVRTLSPATLRAAFPAALTATRLVDVSGGRVDGEASCTVSPPIAPVPAVLAPQVVVRPGARLAGDPAVEEAPAPPPAEPDPFSPALAPTIADLVHHMPAVEPRPTVELGRCVAGPTNWGAVDPHHPCHAHLPLIHVPGSIRMVGGQGRGVLVVGGDALFTDGARFEGAVVVGGRLIAEGASRISGAARSRSALILDGEIQWDECTLAAALSAPALDRAFRPPGRWWVPVF